MPEEKVLQKHCPLCGSAKLLHKFNENKNPIYRCEDCTHMFVNRQSADTMPVSENPSIEPQVDFEAAEEYMDILKAELSMHMEGGHRIADAGASGNMYASASGNVEVGALRIAEIGERRIPETGAPLLDGYSYELTHISCDETASPSLTNNHTEYKNAFDVCILNSVLEYSSDPVETLLYIRRLLKKGGLLLFRLPVSDSPEAWGNKHKHKYNHNHNHNHNHKHNHKYNHNHEHRRSGINGVRQQFFNRATIENVLCKCGYERIRIINTDNNKAFISCRIGDLRDERIISIIVPVYNEEKTVAACLDGIVNKQLVGVRKEIIIVESNSTDSTRQIVEMFAREHSDVKLILQDKPLGKGHAVRAGFSEATGDFIAIQDADLEYDINDYDRLVVPLIHYQKAFVLGSRYAGDWKMRDFGVNNKLSAILMNIGHVFFTSLINIGCGVRLKDPFTMYKLFRSECLCWLEFEGIRFEIDWEIVIKLIMKGYIPEEIPVHYHSRGFKEGKKVSVIMDPLIWIKSFVKYRFLTKPFISQSLKRGDGL